MFYVLAISQSLVVCRTPYKPTVMGQRRSCFSGGSPSSSQPDLVLLWAWAHICSPPQGLTSQEQRLERSLLKRNSRTGNTNNLIPFLSTLYPLNYCLFFLTYDMIFFFLSPSLRFFYFKDSKAEKKHSQPLSNCLNSVTGQRTCAFLGMSVTITMTLTSP